MIKRTMRHATATKNAIMTVTSIAGNAMANEEAGGNEKRVSQ